MLHKARRALQTRINFYEVVKIGKVAKNVLFLAKIIAIGQPFQKGPAGNVKITKR